MNLSTPMREAVALARKNGGTLRQRRIDKSWCTQSGQGSIGHRTVMALVTRGVMRLTPDAYPAVAVLERSSAEPPQKETL